MKTMTRDLDSELALHNEIIDDLEDQMETVNDQLIRNTERTRQIDLRNNTFGLWLIAVTLFIAIVIVALL